MIVGEIQDSSISRSKTTDVRRINQNTKLNVITNVITKIKINNLTY
jgi:hypothetical protein